MSEGSRKRWQDPEARKRMVAGISRARRAKEWTTEERAAMSERCKKIANDPEISARRQAAFKKTCQTDEHKEKAAAAAKISAKLWDDPEYRNRITEAVRNSWTDERRQKMREKAKARCEDGTFVRKIWLTRSKNRLLRELDDFFQTDKESESNPAFKIAFRKAFVAHLEAVTKTSTESALFDIVRVLNTKRPTLEADLFGENSFAHPDLLSDASFTYSTYDRFLKCVSFVFVGEHSDDNRTRTRNGRGKSHAVTRSKIELAFQQEVERLSGSKSEFLPELGDITFSGKKIVIDIDGDIYHAVSTWHCSAMTPVTKDYHAYKVAQTKRLGFRPIRFWGHEIETRKDQCLNFVLGAMNCGRSLGARKCTVKKISKGEAETLVNLWHIQPYNPSTHILAYALTENATGQAVGVLTFSKHHRQPGDETKGKTVVLSRLAFSSRVNVCGGSAKLLAHAKIELSASFDRIVSWSHNRLSDGAVYERLGFIAEASVPPDYHYVGSYSSTIVQKQQAKKCLLRKRLASIAATWSETETEEMLAARLKLSRCYDAGKVRWAMLLH